MKTFPLQGLPFYLVYVFFFGGGALKVKRNKRGGRGREKFHVVKKKEKTFYVAVVDSIPKSVAPKILDLIPRYIRSTLPC